MRGSLFLQLMLCSGAAGLIPSALLQRAQHVAARSELRMGAPAIIAKKAKVVEELKETLSDASLMFCVRSEGITVNEMNGVRQKMPEGTTIRCAKNTLVKRAVEDFPKFQGGDSLMEYSNYWFFVPETDVRQSVETWNAFIKEAKKEDNAIVGGVFEGECLDSQGIEAVTKLPTKQELMGTTAMLLKAVPSKLARGLNAAGAQRLAKGIKEAQGSKLARAVKAMGEKL